MSSKDSMRYHLVTRFICAKCGGPLALSYDMPKDNRFYQAESDNITGAAKVEEKIAIHPCEKCYGEAIAPIKQFASLISAISKIEGE